VAGLGGETHGRLILEAGQISGDGPAYARAAIIRSWSLAQAQAADVDARWLVRSKNCDGKTTSRGSYFSCKLPTAATKMIQRTFNERSA
jgi:hypothetical protein